MREKLLGKVIIGDIKQLKKSFDEFSSINVDLNLQHEELLEPSHTNLKTISETVELSSHGTFDRREIRRIRFEATDKQGWWLKRSDIDGEPVKISHKNAYYVYEGGVNNIVLKRDGDKKSYMRLTEHIIAIRMGSDIDNMLITVDSDDPPLFDLGSAPIIEALDKVEKVRTKEPCRYFTVKEIVSAVWPNGAFLTIAPQDPDCYSLKIDCAINFPNAMGKQRISFPVDEENFKIGSSARTNCSLKHAILCKTIGKFIPSVRHLGYNKENILVVGSKKYINRARLKYKGKSLEAVWHRATLDLLAAFALIDEGRFIGDIISYKSNHKYDVELIKELYKRDLLIEVVPISK